MGDALPIPQEHDADERFAQSEDQYQVAPCHFFKAFTLRR
jgi:hypothetical protein